jgi:PAS domain S-box-containing protein
MTGESILIVEDDGVIALRMQEMLRKSGYIVPDPVAFGEDALEQIGENPPHIVLMDIELMGEIDGIETARITQERYDIPVIYLTAYVDDHRLAKAKETRPYGYIVKPFMDRELLATIDMALHRHALDRKLRESERRYHAVVDRAAEYIFMVECGTGRVVDANPALIRLLGYNGEELQNLTLSAILTGPAGAGILAERVCTETGFVGEARIRGRDSGIHDVEITSSKISLTGSPLMVSVVAHDITERKQAAEAISKANRKLHFLTQITRHDITNSLTAAIAYNGFMTTLVHDPKAKEYLEKQDITLKSINRQLQFTRLYDDIGAESPKWLALDQTITTAMAQFDHSVFHKSPEQFRLEIYADPLFEKVFFNLFENAFRHAKNLHQIAISARESGPDLVIAIQDDGSGIPAEDKEKIFTRGFGSNTGLGLYFSREILDITRIAIRETGTPGSGACFELVVPKGAYRPAA